MFLGSKMGYLGMPNAMAQVRGLSAHFWALQSQKKGFFGTFFNRPAFFNHTLSIILLLGHHYMSREVPKGPRKFLKMNVFITFYCIFKNP